MSHLAYFYRLFPRRITAGFAIPIRKSVGLFLAKVDTDRFTLRMYELSCTHLYTYIASYSEYLNKINYMYKSTQ